MDGSTAQGKCSCGCWAGQSGPSPRRGQIKPPHLEPVKPHFMTPLEIETTHPDLGLLLCLNRGDLPQFLQLQLPWKLWRLPEGQQHLCASEPVSRCRGNMGAAHVT